MKTYITKTAANGATLYYSTESGKRIAKAVALENERNYLLANAEEITAEVDDEEIVDEIDDEEEVSEELDTEDSVEEIDEDAEDDDENEVNENDVTEELNEDRRALETINPEEIVAIATVKMNIAEDEMKLAEAEVDKAYAAAGRISAKTSDEKRKAAYARIDAADAAYKTACEVYKARCEELKAAYVAASEARTAKLAETEETVETAEQVEENVEEQVAEVSEYKPQTSWENPHAYETVGDLDTERYLAARNHFTTVEKLLPELDELKTEIDTVNDKFLRVSFAIDTCKHFFLNKACDPFFLFRHEYNKEADTIIKASVRLYDKCIAIDFDKTFEHLSTFQYIDHGIRNETYHKAWEIFEAIRDNLGDQALASELTKLADEFGIDRALLLQSDDCKFNPALFAEKTAEPAPELTGKMKWAAELLDNYTYEFECDKETGKKGLARHYKRFNRYGEQVGKLVEVFTDKTSFILDHVNIVVKSIRTYYYINGETLSYFKGKFSSIWSDKYKAGMSMVGGEHLQVEVPDGQWKKYKNFMVNDDEFFQIMSERGACTIAEENRKLDEAFTESESPATFKVGKTYLAERRRTGDELATFKILGRSAKFVTAVPVAFADWGETKADNDYVFQRRIYRDDLGDEYFMEPDNQTKVSTGKAYRLDEPEVPMVVEPAEPPVDIFTAKRDKLIAERDVANAKLKEAEEAHKAAERAAYNADDAVMNFMEDAADELRERIDLPAAEIEVKTTEGNLAFICADTVYADFDDTKFTLRGDCSELNGLTLGTYDTPEQVMTAVEQFKAAIERGDKRFDFNQKPDAQNFNQALVA